MQRRITPLNTERKEWTPQELVDRWQHHLQEYDRSVGTVKKYTQAVVRFLAWYEREEQAPLQLLALTPIALIGYRNYLQHDQHKSMSRESRYSSYLLCRKNATVGRIVKESRRPSGRRGAAWLTR